MKEKNKKIEEVESKIELAVPIRGRRFEGYVIKKFSKRLVIQFDRTKFVKKYERYLKKKTKIHARISSDLANSINIGDYIEVAECRPLSKIIHFVVTKKIRDSDEKIKNKIQENVENKKWKL